MGSASAFVIRWINFFTMVSQSPRPSSILPFSNQRRRFSFRSALLQADSRFLVYRICSPIFLAGPFCSQKRKKSCLVTSSCSE